MSSMYYYSEQQNREQEDDDNYVDEDEEDSDGEDEHNHVDYTSATRKAALSNNVDRYSDPFKNPSDDDDQDPPPPPLQQQGIEGILRRDQKLGSDYRSPHAVQSSQGTTSGVHGSRVSGGGAGSAGQARVSGGNAGGGGGSGSEQAAGSGGAAAGSSRRKLSCLSGGFCDACQICNCKKQRQQQAPPQQQRMQRTAGGNVPPNRNAAQTNATPDPSAPPATLKQRVLGCLCCLPRYLQFHITHPSKASLERMQCIARSTTWTVIIVFFTIIMLFGPVIQDLAIPKEGDVVCDVFFTLTFVIMSFDIMIRCYVTSNYWIWKVNLWFLCCCFMKKDRNTSGGAVASEGRQGSAGTVKSGSVRRADGSGSSNSPHKEFSFRVGSFMFWCDFISTATILWDIIYINPQLRDMDTLDLDLNSKYMVVDGISSLNSGVPYEAQYAILVAIARTARIARFIRASVVVKTSSKINWYWIPDHLNPRYWFRRCYNRFSSKKMSGFDDEWGNESLHGGSDEGRGTLSRKSSSKSSLRGGGDVRPNSPAGTNNRKRKTKLFLALLNLLRWNDKEAQKKANAAIKIQRAFRISRDSTYEVGGLNGRASTLDSVKGTGATKKSSLVDQVKKSIRNTPLNKSSSRRVDSHVGSAMRELTGQRVAVGIIIALILTALFTYFEYDSTDANTMVQLFLPTQNPKGNFANRSLNVAHNTSIPDMFKYQFVDGSVRYFEISGRQPDDLRDREILQITVTDVTHANQTIGWFSQRQKVHDEAMIQLASTCFILVIWFFGVTAFAGPVMMLVVTPIERMIRLLTMLMRDPLGYQNTPRYKKFESEDDDFLRNTKWTKDVLKGMETSFLMSTILQIGNLMKVGFGSAGVEIIQNTLQLQKGDRKDVLNLNTQGSTVSCIFLFCDIRQFTDATECLQEEVFVFTNKIAAVVHSICHSYGGSANKNVGDAFLVSWLLDGSRPINVPSDRDNSFVEPFSSGGSLFRRRASNENRHSAATASLNDDELHAYDNQADKALLSVIKICIALYHDDFYTEDMSDAAKERLMDKLKKRKGPVVQMGFGLHAGKAVQGAIGSQRKLDATYIAESVEVSEFLESSTKKYGLKMLMSGDFYKLLHPNQKRRCRKIDQILFHNEDDDVSDAGNMIDEDDVMELHTFDMDIDSLWKTAPNHNRGDPMETASDSEASVRPATAPGNTGLNRSRCNVMEGRNTHDKKSFGRRVSMMALGLGASHHMRDDLQDSQKKSGKDMGMAGYISGAQGVGAGGTGGTPGSPSERDNENGKVRRVPELVLPTGPVPYNTSVWLSDEMKEIRKRYSGGIFFPKFNAGLQSFYARDWEHARQCFQTILERFGDGPSRYFLNIIEESDGVPPRNFNGYGTA